MPSTLCEVPGQPAHGFLLVSYVEPCLCVRWRTFANVGGWGGQIELRGSESAWDLSGM